MPRPARVLVANDEEWFVRSLESILDPARYSVTQTRTSEDIQELIRCGPTDLVVINTRLADMDGVSLCRKLKDEDLIGDHTPVVLIANERPTRQLRLDALTAGAWALLTSPLDPEEVKLRLDTYIRAKLDADDARSDVLVDDLTGLYNKRGLEKRAHELASLAFRRHGALACVVVAPEVELIGDSLPSEAAEIVRKVGESFGEFGRRSDAIGRVSGMEFAIIALDTDSRGAVKLAERLTLAAAASSSPIEGGALQFRGGYEAVQDYHETPIEPGEMMGRAEQAFRRGQPDEPPASQWIRSFSEGSESG
jgi:diguanylate cyclase (GGDEF)-like protein